MPSITFHRKLKFYSREALIALALFLIVWAVDGCVCKAVTITGLAITARVILSYLHKKIWIKIYEEDSYNDQDYEI